MNSERPPQELTEGERNLNKHLIKGAETPQQLRALAADIRRGATSILPPEISLIQDEKVRSVIEQSFLKVGKDIGVLAGIIEKMLADR